MPNFSSILDMPSNEIRFPKLPVGSYVGIVKGMGEYKKSAKKQTPFLEYQVQLVEPVKDENGNSTVDEDELEAFGPLGEKTVPMTFWYESEGGKNRLITFFENCGLETHGESIRVLNEQTPGCTIIVEIKHEPSADSQSIYARIDGTAKYGE